MVLRDKRGERIAEILGRHIRECVDFHHSRKRGACGKAEAVDQPLDHQDAEVHDRLLDTREDRAFHDADHQPPVEPEIGALQAEGGYAQQAVDSHDQRGERLREHGGQRGTRDPHAERQYEEQVERHVRGRRHGERGERDGGIADAAQRGGKKVVEEGEADSPEDDPQVIAGVRPDVRGDVQQRQDAVEIARREQEDREGDRRDEEEGVEDAAPEGVGLPRAEID